MVDILPLPLTRAFNKRFLAHLRNQHLREWIIVNLPSTLPYPLIAIPDLHGQRSQLERLVSRLEKLPEWPACALVFLGDFVDRGPDVPGAIDLVLELLARPAGGSAVLGNHDQALRRATELDNGPPSSYWSKRYSSDYDHISTFQAYLGQSPSQLPGTWPEKFQSLRQAIPPRHADFLSSLLWVVEAPGHLFMHCGLSPELKADAPTQLAALHARRWLREELLPQPGTATDTKWQPEYPVWIGADKQLSKNPLPFPGKVQVTGHDQVRSPHVSPVRIRLDTSGGFHTYPLTACLLREAHSEPVFIATPP